ncbi:DoxX-like family protein [Cohnella nanjingensis]|uniref:DoxX-like family protein n=1 Tax=Cohnella nanjingensis TaxID=1387779 RepID=A0A7X0RM41_9BACL|nr:DoxX-like family protein [Cohnella nanjingensis]MBB6669808.1 DoxX-like family protein [Cohnella nanjingensis]
MRKGKPIYVETVIEADMETLWRHTQTPGLHEQWDLRFSEIAYLPKAPEARVQAFRYATHIGFGLNIGGTGRAAAAKEGQDGSRVSALRFASDDPRSLIRSGAGYWRYVPLPDGKLAFATRYDYDTRFGALGRLFDRAVFRPLFGWATAWSFDALKLWLERGIAPALSLRQTLTHALSVLALASCWIYEGLAPKMLHPASGELALMQAAGWFPGREEQALFALGAAELLIGAAVVRWHRRGWTFGAQAILLILLTAAGAAAQPSLMNAPFGPLTLALPMLALSGIAAGTAAGLPRAGNCRRKPATPERRGGNRDAVHL